MEHRPRPLDTLLSLAAAAAVAFTMSACGDDGIQQEEEELPELCPAGQHHHPVDGACVPNDDGTGDDMGGGGTDDMGGGGTDDMGGGGGMGDMDPPVEGGCPDEVYMEGAGAFFPSADLSALAASYDAATYDQTIFAVLEARYPTGKYLAEEGRKSKDGPFMIDCVDRFSQRGRASFEELIMTLSTVVHECGHILDVSSGRFGRTVVYVVRPDLIVELPELQTFPRSEIKQYTTTDDRYAMIYLEGQSGSQGFGTLMEEFVQYVNSLLVGYAFADYYQGGRRSARDGILTFMTYLQHYLRHARENHPQTYELIAGNTQWREFLLTIWGRAEMALELTKDLSQLSIKGDQIELIVRKPEMEAEIEALRTRHGCR